MNKKKKKKLDGRKLAGARNSCEKRTRTSVEEFVNDVVEGTLETPLRRQTEHFAGISGSDVLEW